MAIKITRWSPDTCPCVIDYEWNDAVPQEARVHVANAIIEACAAHAAVTVPAAHLALVLEENQRKNIFNGDLAGRIDLSGRIVDYVYDAARILLVRIEPLTGPERALLLSRIANDTRFAGRVVIL